MRSFTHAIAVGHIIAMAQHVHRHVCDVTTVINKCEQRWSTEDKRAEKSITAVSCFTIIIRFSQCIRVIKV